MQERDETCRLLLSRAGIATPRFDLATLPSSGYVNELYRISIGRRQWIAKIYRWPWLTCPPAHRALIEFRSTVALRQIGLPVTRVAAICGPDCFDPENVPEAALLQSIRGTLLPDSPFFDSPHLFQIGAHLRQLHEGGIDQHVFVPPLAVHDPSASWAEWLEQIVINQVTQIGTSFLGGLDTSSLSAHLSTLLDQIAYLDEPVAIHHDFHPWNVLVTPSGRHHILDWEMVRYGDPCWDVATFLALWKRRLPVAPLRAFLAGYGPINWERVEVYVVLLALWMAAEYAAGDRSAPSASALGRQLLRHTASGSLLGALHAYRKDLRHVRDEFG